MRTIRGIAPVLLALLAACSSGPEHGTLVGDVYVALQTGEEVDVAATPVHLLPDTPELDSALAQVCVRRNREVAAGEAQEAATERAWAEREQLLRSRSRRRVVTSESATFAFDSVPPGEYRIWSHTTVDDDRWSWLHPVRVRGGDSLRVNLSNDNTDENPFRCSW